MRVVDDANLSASTHTLFGRMWTRNASAFDNRYRHMEFEFMHIFKRNIENEDGIEVPILPIDIIYANSEN